MEGCGVKIKPIEVRSQHSHNDFKWFYELEIKEVRQLEADYKEAIEALEESTIELINLEYSIASHRKHKNAMTTALRKNQTTIKIIEKAYGESWEDIRREK